MRPSPFQVLAICLVATLLGTPRALAQQIWFVDPPGAGPITSLQAAVDLAADGDVIALRGVDFGYAQVLGKGLFIVAVGPAPSSGFWLDVRDLPAGSLLAVRGLAMTDLDLTDCAGAVLVDDCDVTGQHPLAAIRCAHLQLTRCSFTSTQGWGLAAADVRETQLVADECAFTGEEGQPGLNTGWCGAAWGQDGDTGLVVAAQSTAWLQSCTLRGGCGGAAGTCGFGSAGPGAPAPGLRVDATSSAYARGIAALGCAPNSGTIVTSQGPIVRLQAPSTVRPRVQAALGLQGVPLGQGVLLAATRIAPRFVGLEAGWFQSDAGVVGGRVPLGQCNAVGLLAAQVLTPYVVPTGVLPVVIQGVCVTPSGAPRFMPARMVLVAGDQSGL